MKIYHIGYEGDHGEIEGMFNEGGEILGCWSRNDGNWRSEYFDGFIESLGHTIDYDAWKNKKKFHKQCQQEMLRYTGCIE